VLELVGSSDGDTIELPAVTGWGIRLPALGRLPAFEVASSEVTVVGLTPWQGDRATEVCNSVYRIREVLEMARE